MGIPRYECCSTSPKFASTCFFSLEHAQLTHCWQGHQPSAGLVCVILVFMYSQYNDKKSRKCENLHFVKRRRYSCISSCGGRHCIGPMRREGRPDRLLLNDLRQVSQDPDPHNSGIVRRQKARHPDGRFIRVQEGSERIRRGSGRSFEKRKVRKGQA